MRTKIVILGLICLLMMGSVLSAEKKRWINSWQDYFPDRIERVYFVMKDGILFKHTSHYENKIHLNMKDLRNTLKKFNYTIEDIAIIIHNHFKDFRFSSEDYREHRRLKKYGFTGSFLLYSHMTNEVYNIEDKN